MSTVLALETSCDESAAAIVSGRRVLAGAVASQIEEHARWGGVVPEIASRRHVEALPALISRVLAESGLAMADLDAVAATVAPGLAGALLVGSVTARTLARLHAKPFLCVHHLEGHLCSVHLGDPLPEGPYLVLLVSGGHTELVKVEAPGSYVRLGRSRDDAAGECFDKVARLLGLGYPRRACDRGGGGGRGFRPLPLSQGQSFPSPGGLPPLRLQFQRPQDGSAAPGADPEP